MKKGTILWTLVLLIFIAILIIPTTRQIFNTLSMYHPYIMGFINFSILSTMGELLAIRITTKEWTLPAGVLWRFVVWGIVGIMITLVFQIFNNGVATCMATGYLPGGNSQFLLALLTSATMNILFSPTFMGIQRVAETIIELKCGQHEKKMSLKQVVDEIDWHGFISFVLLKTVPFFWIPAHTIAFLLPPEYRVVMAAGLSIVLGVLLSIGKK